jgi:hypothetical protein
LYRNLGHTEALVAEGVRNLTLSQRRIIVILAVMLLLVAAFFTVGSDERSDLRLEQASNRGRGGPSSDQSGLATGAAGTVSIPVPLAVLLALATPAVAAVAILAERDRQEREIEERRWATLREERIRAYATMARLTKTMNPEAEEDPVPALAEAHSEIEMLTDDHQLKVYADALLGDWKALWKFVQEAREQGVENPTGMSGFKVKWDLIDYNRDAFIKRAKAETKPPSRPRQRPGRTAPQGAANE